MTRHVTAQLLRLVATVLAGAIAAAPSVARADDDLEAALDRSVVTTGITVERVFHIEVIRHAGVHVLADPELATCGKVASGDLAGLQYAWAP